MMNYIWAGIIVLSLIFSIVTNRTKELSAGILDGALNAVNISLRLLGTLLLWNGLMETAKLSGLQKKLEKLLFPLVKLIFPNNSKTDAASAISANITANLLGLGNAATPLGLEAMRRMNKNKSNIADNETVRFVVINSAALTIIPTTMVTLRAAHGSENPFSILIPVWLTGITSLVLALVVEKILEKRWK